jgi:hypothetical protein
MEKQRGGRPTVWNEATEAMVLNALSSGQSRMGAAASARICYDTLKSRLTNDPAFVAEVLAAEADYERKCIDTLTSAMPDSWQAAAWWLERRKPQLYGKQEKLHVLRDVARDVSALNDEELAILAYGDEGEDAA